MIYRPAFDEHGIRCASCATCGMVWIEGREPVEMFPGVWTRSGARMHCCPIPMSYERAREAAAFFASSGIPIDQRLKARIRLGLARGPSILTVGQDPTCGS